MKLEIVQINRSKPEARIPYIYYKVFVDEKLMENTKFDDKIHFFWINPKDFSQQKDLLRIEKYKKLKDYDYKYALGGISYGNVFFKTPFEDFFKIESKKLKKGSFYIVLPKVITYPKKTETKTLVQEPEMEYATKPKKTFLPKVDDSLEELTNDPMIIEIIKEELETKRLIKKTKSSSAKEQNKANKTQQKPTSSKQGQFIKDILDYTLNHNIDKSTKDKLVSLIAKQSEIELQKEILDRLDRLEAMDTVRKKRNTKNGGKMRHQPLQTIMLLKKFKYSKKSNGLKQLVHIPADETYSIVDYKKDIKMASDYFYSLKDIPYELYSNIKELIELMQNEGLECYQKTNSHPYQNKKCKMLTDAEKKYKSLYFNSDSNYITNLIQGFKRNYRFDLEKSESSQLRELIINVFNICSYKKDDITNVFDPKYSKTRKNEMYFQIEFDKKFDEYAIFFTWVPNIRDFLKQVGNDILKHGNIKGEQPTNKYEKKEFLSIDRKTDEIEGITKINFSILDKDSIVFKEKELLYKQISEKKDKLVGLCDWRIEADFAEASYKIQLLPETNDPFQKLTNKVGGFKHILTFYEV